MTLYELLELLLDGTNVVLEDEDGIELERYDGRDSLSGDYDYCTITNVCTDIRTTSYGDKEPFITITIEREVD